MVYDPQSTASTVEWKHKDETCYTAKARPL